MTPGLIERLEAAGEGSRELDAEVWMDLVECDRLWRRWAPVDEHHGHGEPQPGALYYAPHCAQVFVTPEVTTSLDAALALAERVLPDLTKINVWTYVRGKHHHCEIETDEDEFDALNASTPALALCIAILKARATQEQG